jgi:Tol biopolymer transport system component
MSWTSRLMIYDFEEGRSFPILETDAHIAAPNWTPDGSSLIVNSNGSLFWVELDAPELLEVDTGLCIKLNNDHGITPNGETLIFSDHSFGQGAVIWTQSLGEEDADPQRLTRQSPSWWHGVSPDGKRVCYTAVREGLFGIYTCALEGGDETCVVQSSAEAKHHFDGPDYTPDGDWIWFNCELAADGASDLWRVRVDGRDLERMSADERVNWFPHPAPIGDKIIYLSYPEGTKGHPSNLNVELRQHMGKDQVPKTLVKLFGGQGTLNVPSWSPDGVAFAYVEYSQNA